MVQLCAWAHLTHAHRGACVVSLATILQGGISIANTVTASLQATVTHKAFSSDDGYGKPTYATGVSLSLIHISEPTRPY